jgi:hypothetical protein
MSNSMNLNLRCEDCFLLGQPWECGCCHNKDHYIKNEPGLLGFYGGVKFKKSEVN